MFVQTSAVIVAECQPCRITRVISLNDHGFGFFPVNNFIRNDWISKISVSEVCNRALGGENVKIPWEK